METVDVPELRRGRSSPSTPIAAKRTATTSASRKGPAEQPVALPDRERLKQVLRPNLISNGVKFNQPGGREHHDVVCCG